MIIDVLKVSSDVYADSTKPGNPYLHNQRVVMRIETFGQCCGIPFVYISSGEIIQLGGDCPVTELEQVEPLTLKVKLAC